MGLKFGRDIANSLRRRVPRRGDKWHLDEVVLSIGGKHHYLWRAVDKDDSVLNVLVQSWRDTKAAKWLLRKLLKKQGVGPRGMMTDKLKSYAGAKRETMPDVEHRQHKGLNNRAENSPSDDETTRRNLGRSRRCSTRCVILACPAVHISPPYAHTGPNKLMAPPGLAQPGILPTCLAVTASP